jgi:hypothetical protein
MYEDITLLQYLDKTIKADLFLEYWSDPGWDISSNAHNSALVDTIIATRSCIPNADRSKCPLQNMRVHMVNIRNIGENVGPQKYLGNTICTKFNQLKDNMPAYASYCRDHFPDVHAQEITDKARFYLDPAINPDKKAQSYWNDVFFRKHSVLHKELSKLPKQLSDDIIKYLTIIPRNIDNTIPGIDSRNAVDVYTVARLLKHTTELGIIYLGGAHTRHISHGLIASGYYERVNFFGVNVGINNEYIYDLTKRGISIQNIIKRFDDSKCFHTKF